MNNGMKTIVGTLIGAGVAYAITHILEDQSDESLGFASAAAPAEPKETLKQRWERAKVAGEEARLAKEAELRSYFRQKVDDPRAFVGK